MKETNGNAIIIPFPQQRGETAELLSLIEQYSGNTAGHINDVLSEVREGIGDALFLHIKPILTEIMWEFAKECKIIGAASLQQLRAKPTEAKTDKRITPIGCNQ